MKKIILLFCLLVNFSLLSAQTEDPIKPSTDTDEFWYTIQALGQGSGRENMYVTVSPPLSGEGMPADDFANYVRGDVVKSGEEMDRQLWKFIEISDEDPGNYLIINKYSGEHLTIAEWYDGSTTPQLINRFYVNGSAFTEKIFTVSASTTSGYYNIRSTDDETMHLTDNWGQRNWCLMVYNDPNGANCKFKFTEHKDGLTVSVDELAFGTVKIGDSSEPKDINAWIAGQATGTIELNIEGDTDVFAIDNSNFGETGGTISIYAEPVEAKTYNAKITFTYGDETIDVLMSVTGTNPLPVTLSPDRENSDGDVWYYIQSSLRSLKFYTDLGVGEDLAANEYSKDNPNQLWKFVDAGSDNAYYMISKNGRTVNYNTNGDPQVFVMTNTITNTFDFSVRQDGLWQIKWNEFVGEEEGDIGYINKINNSSVDSYTAWGALPDDGSAVLFTPATEGYDRGLPQFSTDSDEFWYMIQFDRIRELGLDRVFQADDLAVEGVYALSQTERNIYDGNQYWKLIGNESGCKIVNWFDDKELAYIETTSFVGAVASGSGATYEIIAGSKERMWQLHDLTEGLESPYINDNAQTQVGLYSLNDPGNTLTFIPVNMEDIGASINEIEQNDPVVSFTYYTINGVQVSKPINDGIYIIKQTHQSGKQSAKKILIQSRNK